MKLSSVLAIAILGITAAPAHGAGAWIGAHGGLGWPSGSFDDVAGSGFDIGGSATVPIARMWEVGAEAGWMSFPGDEDNAAWAAIAGQNVDVKFTVVPITAVTRLVVPTGGNIEPFLRGGFGAYMTGTHVDGTTFTDDISETDLGFSLGGGMLWRGGPSVRGGFDVVYHYIATDEATNLFTARMLLEWGTGGR